MPDRRGQSDGSSPTNSTASPERRAAPADLLIVGGGIAGTGTAAALDRDGHGVALADGGSASNGFAMLLMPNGTRALRELGLLAPAIEAGRQVEALSYRNSRDELLNTFDLRGIGAPDPWLLIRWRALQRLLGEAAVDVERLPAVQGIEEDDSSVRVSFVDGSERRFGHVLVADGAGSALRTQVDAAPTVERLGQIWRWMVPRAPDLSDDPPWGLWLGEQATFMAFPVGDGELLCQGVVPALDDHDPPAGRAARIRARFAAFDGTPAGYLERLPADETIVAHTTQQVGLSRWHTERVLVFGDAAHGSSSAARQGAAQALEDALVLAEVLRAEPPGAAAFERFERRRRPRVEVVQQMGRAMETRSAHADAATAARRDEMIRSQTNQQFARPWAGLFEERP